MVTLPLHEAAKATRLRIFMASFIVGVDGSKRPIFLDESPENNILDAREALAAESGAYLGVKVLALLNLD